MEIPPPLSSWSMLPDFMVQATQNVCWSNTVWRNLMGWHKAFQHHYYGKGCCVSLMCIVICIGRTLFYRPFFMNWATSSHRKNWVLTSERLDALRTQSLVQLCSSAGAPTVPDAMRLQLLILQFSEMQLLRLCNLFGRQPATKFTAMMYFKRLYLSHNTCAVVPQTIAICAIWLASKVSMA